MIPEQQELYDQTYESEKRLIGANGGNQKAIRYQFKSLDEQKQELSDYIIRKSLEFVARESALSDVLDELRAEKESILYCPYCKHLLESHVRVSDSIHDGSKCNVEGCNCHRKPEGSI